MPSALIGVSYLCMSQWRVAPLRPPALKAIVPWEGVADLLREFGYQDGIPETGFIGVWWRNRMQRGHNRRFPMVEDFPAERDARPLDDAWWAGKRPALENIDVPALVCASWSDQGLHTRGSFEGFERIGSSEKWLYTHGRRKWEAFYAPECPRRSAPLLQPLPQRRARTDGKRRRASGSRFVSHAPNTTCATKPLGRCARLTYDTALPRRAKRYARTRSAGHPRRRELQRGAITARVKERASFVYRFERDTELTGSMSLKLWVSTSEGDDLDLFVALRKFDARNREVPFYGYNGYANDCVCKGWLRASHRELDPARSRPGRPWHTHASRRPVKADEVVPVEIELLSSCTIFEGGSSLRLDVLGQDADSYPAFRHKHTVNRGRHTIHTGAAFDSHLLVPIAGG